MAANTFRAQLTAFVNKAEDAALSAFQATTTSSHAVIDAGTPVLTGKTRANNQVAINTAQMNELEEQDPSGSAARARAASTSVSLALGDAAVLGNPLDHIVDLENGSSRKSPGGFYAMAREEAPGFFKREFLAAMR